MHLTKIEKRILFNCLRQAIYFVCCMLFALSLRLSAKYYGDATFKEFGIIENIQLGLLTLSSFSFFLLSFLSKKFKPLLMLFSALCLFAFCRELDAFFEKILPIISWKFCYIFPIFAAIYLFKTRKTLKKQLLLFCSSPAFYIMCTAMIIFIPIAQTIGNRAFISNVLPEATDIITIRRFIEESGEIIAYFLLFLASIEFYISLIFKKK